MPKYVIEREIPNVGSLGDRDIQAIAKKSRSVLEKMGSKIQWLESFVTGNKIYCIYIATDEETVREHARLGGFPANSISEIKRMMDPTTADG
jgi:Nickel responsive protein SCO4226-like